MKVPSIQVHLQISLKVACCLSFVSHFRTRFQARSAHGIDPWQGENGRCSDWLQEVFFFTNSNSCWGWRSIVKVCSWGILWAYFLYKDLKGSIVWQKFAGKLRKKFARTPPKRRTAPKVRTFVIIFLYWLPGPQNTCLPGKRSQRQMLCGMFWFRSWMIASFVCRTNRPYQMLTRRSFLSSVLHGVTCCWCFRKLLISLGICCFCIVFGWNQVSLWCIGLKVFPEWRTKAHGNDPTWRRCLFCLFVSGCVVWNTICDGYHHVFRWIIWHEMWCPINW